MTSKNNGYLPSNPICTGLVAEAFEASRKLHLENKRSWYRNITEVIDYFGMDKCKIFNLKSNLVKMFLWLYVPQFRYGSKTN
jgi:hypothetical protein